MPLHAVISVHGEAGLREPLAIEIADFLPVGWAQGNAAGMRSGWAPAINGPAPFVAA